MDKNVVAEKFVVFSEKKTLELLRKNSKTEALGDVRNRKRRTYGDVERRYIQTIPINVQPDVVTFPVFIPRKTSNVYKFIPSFHSVISGRNSILTREHWHLPTRHYFIIHSQTLVLEVSENCTDEVTHRRSHNELSSCV
jgi:hypothetical protein